MACWGQGEVHTQFWWGNWRESYHLKGLGAGWKVTISSSLRYRWSDGGEGAHMVWIDLIEDRDKWQAVLNKVINPQLS